MAALFSGWAHIAGLMLLTLARLAHAKQPNVIFILTDDQDLHMNSLEHMPMVQKYLVDEGTSYSNHFCTIAICCPSRVNLWTGKAAHNTNVTDVSPPYGGYPKFVEGGFNEDYLPVWLQNAGYNTYYTGKLWNGYSVDTFNDPPAGGFNGSEILLDPNTYDYYNPVLSRNGEAPVDYKGEYSTDLLAEKTYEFLDEATSHDEPFFLGVAPIAPHSEIRHDPFVSAVPQYPERHADLFKDYKIPRGANFNPEKFSGVSWIATLPQLNDTVIDYNDEFQRARLRSLQSVDEIVEELVKRLEEKGILDDTYIFYTTDNGFHLSQYRMIAGKECGYETDIHIPLVVRGPGVAAGQVIDSATSHTHLAPTILSIAGQTRDDFDALPIPLSVDDTDKGPYEHIGVEFWGVAIPEGQYGYEGIPPFQGGQENNTYKAIRLIGEEYNLYYSVWCTNEREYYDLITDPAQMENIALDLSLSLKYRLADRPFDQLINRLDALTLVVKSCKSTECIEPWKVLHPQGDVLTLKDALDEKYDEFYQGQPRVSFSSCELGYIKEAEGPQDANIYDNDNPPIRRNSEFRRTFEYEGYWNDWT